MATAELERTESWIQADKAVARFISFKDSDDHELPYFTRNLIPVYHLWGQISGVEGNISLRRPLELSVSVSDGIWFASASDLNLFGNGETLDAAVDDLRAFLVHDYFEIGQAEDESLSEGALLLKRTYSELVSNADSAVHD